MPPMALPYSGRYPPVMTFTSLKNSAESGVPRMPNAGSLTDTPSMRKAFSGEVVPWREMP
jgi:hypothetical protein